MSPTYPAQAAQNHISGMVVLDVLIAKDGAVKNVTVTSGDRGAHRRRWML